MANKKWKQSRERRDGSSFVALPVVVLDSHGYRLASHTSRSLLVDIARQFTGTNNGSLVACMKFLKPKGWKSHDVITRALRELIACGLLIETRKGMRPNRAAWHALAWQKLDVTIGLDIDAKAYRTGGYCLPQNAGLNPSHGIEGMRIAPSRGIRAPSAIPSRGAIQ